MNPLIVVLAFALAVCAINVHLVKDFLKLKQSKGVVLFLCNQHEFHTIFTTLNDGNMFVKIIDLKCESFQSRAALPHQVYAKSSFVFDYGCDSYLDILEKFSDHQYFNLTFSWLFTTAHEDSPMQLTKFFLHSKGIQMNSDITTTLKIQDSDGAFELFGVYSPGRHLCRDIYQFRYGKWNNMSGMNIVPGFSIYKSRIDFKGLRMRAVTVIDRDNVTSDDVERILSTPGREAGVTLFIKYHYALLAILRDYHNFTFHFRITRGWAGRLKSGYRLGLLGVLERNEADVATTGVLHRRNRHDEYDFIHFSWEFTTGFLYRMTPQLRDSSGTGSFWTPFDGLVWLSSAVTVMAVLFVLKLVSKIISKARRYEPSNPLVSYIVDVIATIAQQGVSNEVSGLISIRIIIFSLLFLTLLLYNYYTSSVVGGLLSSPGKGPQTLQELTTSPLTLSFADIGYHKVLFAETKNPEIREMYRKKVQPSREAKHTIPVYTDVLTAVPYLQQGGYAFHCEFTEAFQEIANQFDAYEICELRTGASLFSDLKLLGLILPKRSMYSEIFKTTLMRAQEVGLVKRHLVMYRPGKPACQTGSRIHPVELTSVQAAFTVLGVGFAVSLVLLSIERLWFNSVIKRESMNFIE